MVKKLAVMVAGGVLALGLQALPAHAGPVDYVRVCDTNGAGSIYIPGTDKCLNMNTVAASVQESSQFASQLNQLANQVNEANEGIAISYAMPAPFVPAGKSFAVNVNFGNFQGANALAAGAVYKMNDALYLSGGVGVGLDNGTVGSRAGVMFAW